MQPDVERRQGLERDREDKGAQPDPGLEDGVYGERTAPAIDESSDPEAAQRKPCHERSEDRADSQDRIAEQEVEHPGPSDFIEKAADAREKAEDQHATTEGSGRSGRDHRHRSIQVTTSPGYVAVASAPRVAPRGPDRPNIA